MMSSSDNLPHHLQPKDDIDAFIASVTIPPPPSQETTPTKHMHHTRLPHQILTKKKSPKVQVMVNASRPDVVPVMDPLDQVIPPAQFPTKKRQSKLHTLDQLVLSEDAGLPALDDELAKLVMPPPPTATLPDLQDITIVPPVDIKSPASTPSPTTITETQQQSVEKVKEQPPPSSLEKVQGQLPSSTVCTVPTAADGTGTVQTVQAVHSVQSVQAADEADKSSDESASGKVLTCKQLFEAKTEKSQLETQLGRSGSVKSKIKTSRPTTAPPPPPTEYRRSYSAPSVSNGKLLSKPAPPTRLSSLDTRAAGCATMSRYTSSNKKDSRIGAVRRATELYTQHMSSQIGGTLPRQRPGSASSKRAPPPAPPPRRSSMPPVTATDTPGDVSPRHTVTTMRRNYENISHSHSHSDPVLTQVRVEGHSWVCAQTSLPVTMPTAPQVQQPDVKQIQHPDVKQVTAEEASAAKLRAFVSPSIQRRTTMLLENITPDPVSTPGDYIYVGSCSPSLGRARTCSSGSASPQTGSSPMSSPRPLRHSSFGKDSSPFRTFLGEHRHNRAGSSPESSVPSSPRTPDVNTPRTPDVNTPRTPERGSVSTHPLNDVTSASSSPVTSTPPSQPSPKVITCHETVSPESLNRARSSLKTTPNSPKLQVSHPIQLRLYGALEVSGANPTMHPKIKIIITYFH